MAKRPGPATTTEPKGSERGQATKHGDLVVEHIAKKNGAVQVLPTSKLHFQKIKPTQPTRVRDKVIDFDFEEEEAASVSVKATPTTCALCGLESMEALGEFLPLKRPSDSKVYHVHENCLWYSQRNQDETDSMLLHRIYTTNRKCCYDQCKRKKRASVTCIVKSCPNVFHFMCAKRAGAELCPNQFHSKLYCKDHMARATQVKKSQCQWPKPLEIEYITRNNWTMMPIGIFNFILDNRDAWEKYTPEWFKTDLEPRISVREIFPGHWAWCDELGKGQSKAQYEVVANNDIDTDEFICEYVGAVKYHRDCVKSRYVAAFYIPETINFAEDLCLDAETCGNEARFINSISPMTPPCIQQNATMSTVWCRGELRIIVSAIRDIPKYHPIVLNYDEFENSYFEKSLTPTERRVKRLQATPPGPFVYLSVGDQGPDPLLEEEIRENRQIRMEQRRQAKQDVESMFAGLTTTMESKPQAKKEKTVPKSKPLKTPEKPQTKPKQTATLNNANPKQKKPVENGMLEYSTPLKAREQRPMDQKVKQSGQQQQIPKQNNTVSEKLLAKKIPKVTEKKINAQEKQGKQIKKVRQLAQHDAQKAIAKRQSMKPVQNKPEKQLELKQKQQQQQSEQMVPLSPPQPEIIEIDDDDVSPSMQPIVGRKKSTPTVSKRANVSPKPKLVVAKAVNSPSKRTFAEISDSDIGSDEESEYEPQSPKRQKTSQQSPSRSSRSLTKRHSLHSFMPSLAPIIIDDDDDLGVVHVDEMSEDEINKDLINHQ